MSFIELATAMCVAVTMSAFALPLARGAVDEQRARQAAGFAASRLREARQTAVTRSAATGLVFDRVGDRWTFRACTDGNANGLKRADVRIGRDLCANGAVDLGTLFPGVIVAVDSRLRGPDGDPPSTDAVKFGVTDIASFSPDGGVYSRLAVPAVGSWHAVRRENRRWIRPGPRAPVRPFRRRLEGSVIRRVQLGQHVRLLNETEEGCELEGETRLCPGQVVDVVREVNTSAAFVRSAFVLSWFVARVGREGPVYQGHCHWQ